MQDRHSRLQAALRGHTRRCAQLIDETWAAHKHIDAVTRAQQDLVEAVHALHRVVCVKGCARARGA
jgi:RNA-splicing ligase RtcB